MRFRSRRSRGFQNRSPLAAELLQLEPRALPTGIVTAAVSGQNVTITGDRLDNSILIEVRADGVFLTGLAGEAAETNTTLKFGGQPVAVGTPVQLTTTPSLKNLTIQMGDGNDNVRIEVGEALPDPIPVPVPSPLAVTITGRVRISLGKGDDHGVLLVNHATLNITGNLEGDLEAGNDCLVIGPAVAFDDSSNEIPDPLPIQVGGQAILLGRLGNDVITLVGAEVQKAVTIKGDDGADSITLGSATLHGNLSIEGNKGNDVLLLGLTSVAGTTSIRGDAGADQVIIAQVTASKNVVVNLGNGDDQLAVSSLTVNVETIRVTFDGGAGTDSLTSAEVITDPPTKLKSIENAAADIDAEAIIVSLESLTNECLDLTAPILP